MTLLLINTRPVTDYDGEYAGKLKDLLAASPAEIHHPLVIAIAIKRRSGTLIVPMSDVAVLIAPAIPFNKRIADDEVPGTAETDPFGGPGACHPSGDERPFRRGYWQGPMGCGY